MHPHLMEIGGSQIIALELAEGAARAGHDVLVTGPDGPLVERVRTMGLPYVHTPVQGRWPSLANVRRLTALARDHRSEVVHGYEWGPCIDLSFGPHRALGVPMVTTVLSMDVPDFLPVHAPLVVGTQTLVDGQRHRMRAPVHLIEPPVDTSLNAPGLRPPGTEGTRIAGFERDDVVVAVVCRLTTDLDKAPGVLEAVEAVGALPAACRVRLLVVGDGPESPRIAERAAAVNAACGERRVVLTGPLLDPRQAYDDADVVLGMGGSALKGLAYGKPLVVQGEHGFWALLTPESVDTFLQQGWFGQGDGPGTVDLAAVLEALAREPDRRAELGRFGLDLVRRRFSLEVAVQRQLEVYEDAVAAAPSRARIHRALVPTAREVAKFRTVVSARAVRAGLSERAGRRGAEPRTAAR